MPNRGNTGSQGAKRIIAGVVVWRFVNRRLQILLVHQSDKHKALWSIPKGGARPNEDFEKAARREVQEETNVNLENVEFLAYVDYGFAVKRMYCYMGPCPAQFELKAKQPEIDKVGFFDVGIAKKMVDKRQRNLIRTMQKILAFGNVRRTTA